MFRLLAIAAAVSVACGVPANGALADCRVELITRNVACPEPRDNNREVCRKTWRTIICETTSDHLAKSHLPDDELPSDQLPESRMPESQLPD